MSNHNPSLASRSLVQCLQDLREFRASQPAHDLSVFRYRNEGHPFCAGGWGWLIVLHYSTCYRRKRPPNLIHVYQM